MSTRVVCVTTSYPRDPSDIAGAFVRDGVERLRAAGIDVEVVSPASFRHYGIAFGHGIVGNLRRAPWKSVAIPFFLAALSRAAREAARDADVVHAHWIPSGFAAWRTGKPFVLQLWGTDAALARRAPIVARPVIRAAAVVVCASRALADDAEALGAKDVRVIPNGVVVPDRVAPPDEPPHILYVGRLSDEKGVRELRAAARDLPLRVIGDGPLRPLFPETAGFVSPEAVGVHYERAAVVVVPSRREGYGVVAREAMAYGRAVVASRVGGLTDAIEDGQTGLLVPPGDVVALRSALVRLLEDAELRGRLGASARLYAAERLSWSSTVEGLRVAYRDACERRT